MNKHVNFAIITSMENQNKKILLSGVKPTGRPHIGNYFGAMKQFLDLQNEYESYVFIADYHALTTVQNGKELKQNTLDLILDYIAIGLDPEKVTLFKQSDVPQVTELAWLFNCVTTMPYLMRAHAFKDAEAKNKEINVGLFDYPILMAADILIANADVVPVGQDQKQHVEYARDTAEKFNRIFLASPKLGAEAGEPIFKLPEPLILKEMETVPGIDGRKMSKSYGNIIPLFATTEEIKKAVMSIATDSLGVAEPKNPDTNNIFAIHKLLLTEDKIQALRAKYEQGGLGYKEAKELLCADLEAFIGPLRARREALAQNMPSVLTILAKGGERARERAEAKMKQIRRITGLNIY